MCSARGVGEKQKGRFVKNHPFGLLKDVLQGLDVLGLPALRALDYVELDALAFLKRTEAVALDGGVMHEDVVAILTADKSEALGIVKPFHCSLFHFSYFLKLFLNFAASTIGVHQLDIVALRKTRLLQTMCQDYHS